MAPGHAQQGVGAGPLAGQAGDPVHHLDLDFLREATLARQAKDLVAPRPMRLQVLRQPVGRLQGALLDAAVSLVDFTSPVDARGTAGALKGEKPASGSAKAAMMSARNCGWFSFTGKT